MANKRITRLSVIARKRIHDAEIAERNRELAAERSICPTCGELTVMVENISTELDTYFLTRERRIMNYRCFRCGSLGTKIFERPTDGSMGWYTSSAEWHHADKTVEPRPYQHIYEY